MKSYFLFAACWLAILSANAQSTGQDYLVTTKGDTLHGRIQLVGGQNKTVRLFRRGQPSADFTPTEAISYGDATGPIGVSKMVGPHGNQQFVTPLIEGYVSLFSVEREGGKAHFLLQPADSTYLIEVPPTTARLTYLRVLPNCPTLNFAYSEIERRYPYNHSGLTRLITAYNACIQPQQVSRTVNARASRTSFGAKAGINVSSFDMSQRFVGNQETVIGYQAGFFMHFTTKSRISVQPELLYLTLRSKYAPTNFPNGVTAYTTTRTLQVDYSQIQLPILFRYTLSGRTLQPYFNLGPSYGLNFNTKSTDSYQQSNKSEPDVQPIAITGRNSFGLAAGAGLFIQRPALPVISVELRYDKMLDATGYFSTPPTHQSLRLDLGVAF